VPAKVGLERISESRLNFSMFEQEENLKKAWDNYEKISKKYPNIVIIDGEKSVEDVFRDIREAIERII
jgi:thymidylate kinase